MGTTNILILSHTSEISHFKIGSHHYASKLANKGYKIYYSGVPQSFIHKLMRRKQYGSNKLDAKIDILNIPTVFPITLKNFFINSLLNKFYWKFKFKTKISFDLIICDYPYFIPFIESLNYKKLIYRPTDDYLSMGGRKVIYYESRILRLASKVVCTSTVVKKKIIERYNFKDLSQIHVLENGYDSDFFFVNGNRTRKNCVYVGSLDERFSFDDLHVFANKFPYIDFDIYGPQSELSRKFENSNRLNNVHFKGVLEYSNVPSVLNNYKVGLLPLTSIESNKGRSPMKLWEYYSCGLDVVYTNISHINSKLFFCYDCSSQESMEDIFQKALSNTRNYNGIDDILLENSWEYKVDKLIEICK